jgi:nitrate reductase assembly molybdenum cofactor insertion protein NarJ
MNKLIIIAFLLLSVQSWSQPSGRVFSGNLNDMSEQDLINCLNNDGTDYGMDIAVLDEVIIDSTTDCSRIKFLSGFKGLDLSINLDSLPKEFNNNAFNSLTHLKLECNNRVVDISSIGSCSNLTNLFMLNFEGEKLSDKKLRLNQLKELTIYKGEKLKKLDAISQCTKLTRLTIEAPYLESFPKFHSNNKIDYLSLESFFDIENLKYLTALTTLGLKTNMNEIPDYLPPNVISLSINGTHSKLQDVENIKKYKYLKDLSLYSFIITDTISKFNDVSLEKLTISGRSDNAGNLNFIFTFNQIDELTLRGLLRGQSLDCGDCSAKFKVVKLEKVYRIDNLDSFFNCDIAESITISQTSIDSLPVLDDLKKIPIVIIERNKNLTSEDIFISKSWRIENNGTNSF